MLELPKLEFCDTMDADGQEDGWAKLRESFSQGAKVAGEKLKLGGAIATQLLEDNGVDTEKLGHQWETTRTKVADGARRAGEEIKQGAAVANEAIAREMPGIKEKLRDGTAQAREAVGALADSLAEEYKASEFGGQRLELTYDDEPIIAARTAAVTSEHKQRFARARSSRPRALTPSLSAGSTSRACRWASRSRGARPTAPRSFHGHMHSGRRMVTTVWSASNPPRRILRVESSASNQPSLAFPLTCLSLS